MSDKSFLHWPFFEPRHRELADRLEAWAATICRTSTMTTSIRRAETLSLRLGVMVG